MRLSGQGAVVSVAGGCPQLGSAGAQCTLQHSRGSPIPAALNAPGSALTLALWRGIQSNTMMGHRASAGKCPALSLQPRLPPQGGPETPTEEPALCQQWVPAPHCSPCGSAPLSSSLCVLTAPELLAKVTCPTWAPQPGEAQQCLLPRMLLPTGEPQGVPQENHTVRYLQPDPTLGPWFPPCFLFPHRPQHLRQK